MIQTPLFSQFLEPQKLKEGKDKCPCCGKLMRAYCKTLDKRLVLLAKEAFSYMNKQGLKTVAIGEMFGGDYKKVNDFQKLGYFGLFERCEGRNRWQLTPIGKRFFAGEMKIPKRVWIFNNQIVDSEDELVTVDQVDPRWQECRSDYTFDYVPQRYETVPKL